MNNSYFKPNNGGTASTKSNATNIFRALTLIFTFGLCFLSPKGISAADDVTTQSSQTIQYEISAEDEAMLQSLGITPEALLQDPNLVNKIQSAIQYELGNRDWENFDRDNEDDSTDSGPRNGISVDITAEKGGNGPLGWKITVTVTIKVLGVTLASWDIITIELVVPPNPDGDNNDWIVLPNDYMDVRWEQMTYDLLPNSPELPTSPGSPESPIVVAKPIAGYEMPEIVLMAPVYEGNIEIGYVVDAHYYEQYPDAIAYFTTEVDTNSIKVEMKDSTILSERIHNAIIKVLLEYKDNNSFRVLSKTGAQTTLEFDNKEGANLKFNVYDLQGTVVKTINSMNENITIDGLPSGTYFIECTTDNTLRTKIVIAQ